MNFTYCFPGGRRQALTFSYDDGTLHDRKLVEIFNRHHMKCTFNLNSGVVHPERIPHSEYKKIYAGHEVACHGLTHHNYPRIPDVQTIEEILEDRRNLERLMGYPVRGLAYPCGRFDEGSIKLLKSLGIVYSRTVINTNNFDIPEEFLKWHPSCHHKSENLFKLGKRLLTEPYGMNLMYVWGHSYEFNNDNNWNLIEDFCAEMANHDTVWYATNMEIYDYVQASHNLIFGIDGKIIRNPSAIDLWVMSNYETPVEIPAGQTITLE